MTKTMSETPIQQVQSAVEAGKLSQSAADNIRLWLTEPRYADYVEEVKQHIAEGKWQQLDDVFWTVIPFGTGGRRGRMYPIGSNAINDRTVGESAQGLANYVLQYRARLEAEGQVPDSNLSCAIAYDTRHKSRHFAELCASIMVANGFRVHFLDDYRSTPELSFLVRYRNCACGIMVTASHNPPSDNAVKVYWSTGGQLVPPHDKECIAEVGKVEEIHTTPFAEAVADGHVELCREEVDREFLKRHLEMASDGPRDLKLIYSPLHGVGEFNVMSLLNATGFDEVEVFEPHRKPDGDFPNVPQNTSNPENKAVFDDIIVRAREIEADLILATDPDCDRLGAAAPVKFGDYSSWNTFTGNQIGVMLADYVLGQWQKKGKLSADNFVVTTLVTTGMIGEVCRHFGVRCENNNLVGFKWIGALMDKLGPDKFVFGTEESHGYLVGQYARDKDGAVACLLMSELAALVKSQGKSLHEHLDSLFEKYGLHNEGLMTIQMEGSDGMKRMQALMSRFRTDPPEEIGGIKVAGIRDYLNGTHTLVGEGTRPLDGPTGDLIFLDLKEEGNYVAIRPSGTEPKVKFYMFTKFNPAGVGKLGGLKSLSQDRLKTFEKDLRAFENRI